MFIIFNSIILHECNFSRLQLSDGQYRIEKMTFADEIDPMRPLHVTGEYSYRDGINGGTVRVTYTAGVEGFRAHVEFPASELTPMLNITKQSNRILPTKLQEVDNIGCALRNSLCGK